MNRLIIWLSLLCIFMQARAVTISPLVIELNTDYRLISQLVVTNNSTQNLALEANVHQLIFQPNGEMNTSSTQDKNVLVFPPAVILEPGKPQTFRLQWVSTQPLETSNSYFIRFSTLNVGQDQESDRNLNKFSKGINIQLNYNALLHVYSSSLQPDVKVDIDQKGHLTLTNSGSRFTYTTALFFKNLDPNSLEILYKVLGAQFIPPHSTLVFSTSEPELPLGTYYGYER